MKKVISFVMCLMLVTAFTYGVRTALTEQTLTIITNGWILTDNLTAAIADGHKFTNSGDVFFVIENAGVK